MYGIQFSSMMILISLISFQVNVLEHPHLPQSPSMVHVFLKRNVATKEAPLTDTVLLVLECAAHSRKFSNFSKCPRLFGQRFFWGDWKPFWTEWLFRLRDFLNRYRVTTPRPDKPQVYHINVRIFEFYCAFSLCQLFVCVQQCLLRYFKLKASWVKTLRQVVVKITPKSRCARKWCCYVSKPLQIDF